MAKDCYFEINMRGFFVSNRKVFDQDLELQSRIGKAVYRCSVQIM